MTGLDRSGPQRDRAFVDTLETTDLVQRIKQAIRQVDLAPLDAGDISVVGIDVALKLETTLSAGGDVKLTIPVINLEIAASRKRTWKNLDELEINLAAPERSTEAEAQSEDPIVSGLANAANAVFAAVATAQTGPPVYDLEKASYSLSFVVSDEGKVAFVFAGEAAKEVTQVITFHFKRFAGAPKPG